MSSGKQAVYTLHRTNSPFFSPLIVIIHLHTVVIYSSCLLSIHTHELNGSMNPSLHSVGKVYFSDCFKVYVLEKTLKKLHMLRSDFDGHRRKGRNPT